MSDTPTPTKPKSPPIKVGTTRPAPVRTATPPTQSVARSASGRQTLDTVQEYVRGLYYGDPGSGKTTASAAAARLGKVVHIDAEKRLRPGPLTRQGIPAENIEPRMHTADEPITFESMLALAAELQNRLADKEPIFAVVWDSGTETHRLLLENLVDKAALAAEMVGKNRDIYRNYQEDYGDMTEQMRRIIRRFRDLPCHLIITSLAKRDTDETGGIRVAPAFTPAVLRDVMGYMDVVAHTRVELIGDVEEYSALTRPVGKYDAKDSFGLLPRVLINPTFDRVLGYVREELKAATDPVQQEAKARRLASATPAA